MFQKIRPIVFFLPLGVLIATVAAGFWNQESLVKAATAANAWILAHFSLLFSWGSFFFVLTCLWAFFSPLGRIRIGGKGADPLLSKWAWFSVTLCTTIAIGILFWATAEPIFHLYGPPVGLGYKPASAEAARFAMTSLYMHWSFTPYAIYTVPGLAFALAYYNLDKDYSLNGPLSFVLGKWTQGVGGDLIDAIALFALIAGIAATLGAGMMSIGGGLAAVLGIETSPMLEAAVTAAIVATFVISSITGLQNGIRVLSSINIRFFFALVVFIFFVGPTTEMLALGWEGLQGYVVEFLPRSLGEGAGGDDAWTRDWTVFYWANWLAWAPITALFLGRIARGYTVRAFILVNFFAPALFAIVWMTVFGGTAISLDLSGAGELKSVLDQSGPEAIAYAVLERFPLSTILMTMFVFLSFISYVTAADSNTEAIAGVCERVTAHGSAEAVDQEPTSIWIKGILAGLIGISAWTMTAFTGIDGVRMLSNLGGLPALAIVLLMNISLIRFGTHHLKRL